MHFGGGLRPAVLWANDDGGLYLALFFSQGNQKLSICIYNMSTVSTTLSSCITLRSNSHVRFPFETYFKNTKNKRTSVQTIICQTQQNCIECNFTLNSAQKRLNQVCLFASNQEQRESYGAVQFRCNFSVHGRLNCAVLRLRAADFVENYFMEKQFNFYFSIFLRFLFITSMNKARDQGCEAKTH